MTTFFKRAVWYKNRLAAMSNAEVLYRVGEVLKRRTDFFFGKRFIAMPRRDFGTLPAIPGLREGLEAWPIPGATLKQWEDAARRTQAGTPILLNRRWPPCPSQDVWHFDPVSSTLWPRDLYCFSIDYRHAKQSGDIKFVWELNRLQYLQPISALACKRKDEKLAQFCLDALESWIDNNPPFQGVNWSSGIELTLRAISILTVTTLVGEYLSRAVRGKIWATLETHARWLARYPSRHSSANNHRAAEGLGLFVIGSLCPHLAHAEKWKKDGWAVLNEAARLQILPDGSGAEQTVAYTAFLLEMLLTGLKIAESTGEVVSTTYRRKLTLGGEYLRWLTDFSGNQPHIGDDDNACIFGTFHEGDAYISSITASVAAVIGRADLTPPNLQPHLRQALFGFPPAPDFAPRGLRLFPYGGLAVGRHNSTNGEILLAFDYGYLGYLSIAAHGHADALSLWLHIDGQPIFIDAGTYMYHAQEHERRFFRSTAAHNTLVLEGQDSSVTAGNFNWSHQARATLRDVTSGGDFWSVEAEHDGYAKRFGVLHRRTLNVSPSTGAVIEDKLVSSSPHKVEIGFMLHPDLTARCEGNEIILLKGEKQVLRMRHEGELETLIGVAGAENGGWYSSSFAVKQPTTRITYVGTLMPEQKAVTRLYWAQ